MVSVDLLLVVLTGIKSALIGMLLAFGIGPWFTYRHLIRLQTEDIPVERSHKKVRAAVYRRYLDGAVPIKDLFTYLQTSMKGWDFINADKSFVLMEYLHRHRTDAVDDSYLDDPYFVDPGKESNDAAHAILHWIYHDPDWEMLYTCLRAGLTPNELRDHVDGDRMLTRDEAEFLAALHPDTHSR